MSRVSGYQYQTKQRDCNIRWNILQPENYIKDKVVLDIGCAEGWFVEKALECGARRAIGIDIGDYDWQGKGEYLVADVFLDIKANVAFLLSVPIDIEVAEHLRNNGIEIIFFEPYLDSENKSFWKEDKWLQHFREVGYEFYQMGVSDRGRSLYLLRLTNVYRRRDEAVKRNVNENECKFYNTFHHDAYVLPHQFEGNNLVLPWAETTLRLSGEFTHIRDIEEIANWLHSLGIVHGDIRVSNVVIYQGRAYLVDFELWRYGNSEEVKNVKGGRGVEYIRDAILSGMIRYYE